MNNTTTTNDPWTMGEPVSRDFDSMYYHEVLFAHGPLIGISGPAEAMGTTAEQAEANARLIASAPAMLEALQDCLALMVNGPEGCDDDPVRIETATRAAIAQAGGAS